MCSEVLWQMCLTVLAQQPGAAMYCAVFILVDLFGILQSLVWKHHRSSTLCRETLKNSCFITHLNPGVN